MDDSPHLESLIATGSVFPRPCVRDSEGTQIALAQVWRELRARTSIVLHSSCSDDRAYLVLRSEPVHAPASAVNERSLRFLEQVIAGDCQKVVALDNGISNSSVAQLLGAALATMGMRTRVSRVPILITMAVHAHLGSGVTTQATVVHTNDGGHRVRIFFAERPDRALRGLLTAAEYAVARLYLEGKSYAEIAALRDVSTRTIANQLSSIAKTLGVSGRAALLRLLLRTPSSSSHPQVSATVAALRRSSIIAVSTA